MASQVLSHPDAESLGIDESIFVKPEQLHLTIVMLKLYSDDLRFRAQQLLQDLQPQVQALLDGQPLRYHHHLHVQSVVCNMHKISYNFQTAVASQHSIT